MTQRGKSMMLSIMNERHVLLACNMHVMHGNDKHRKNMHSWHVVLKVIIKKKNEIVHVRR